METKLGTNQPTGHWLWQINKNDFTRIHFFPEVFRVRERGRGDLVEDGPKTKPRWHVPGAGNVWGWGWGDLDLWHGGDVDGLNVVLELLDLLAQLIDGDLLVLDDAHHLKLVDAVADGNEFG